MTDQKPASLHDRLRAELDCTDRPFGIITRLRAVNAAAAETLAAIMAGVVPASRQEPGNLTYEVSRDAADPLLFVLYDRWASLDAVVEHEATEHFKAGAARMKGLIAGKPEVSILQLVGEPDGHAHGAGQAEAAMVHGTRDDFPERWNSGGGGSTRHVEGGGMTMSFNRFPAGDFAPFFAGLPGDRCVAHHWGYQLKGRMRIHYADGTEEVIGPGEAYYLAPGHGVTFLEECEQIEFSPTGEYARVVEVATRNAAMRGAEG